MFAVACSAGDQVLFPADIGPAPANESSPLGTNLLPLADYGEEWAFVDAFKTSRDWISGTRDIWNDGRAVAVDANGWVTALAADQIAHTLILRELEGRYPAGRYIVLYDGQGTLEYDLDATLDEAASAPGRDVLDVAPDDGGIHLAITATSAADPIRNIRVIMPGGSCEADPFAGCTTDDDCDGPCLPFEDTYETRRFHPTFLSRLRSYGLVRFTNWMNINDSTQQTWADRPRVEEARWVRAGAPVEVMVELANTLGADAWFSMPHLADDDYVRQFAAVVATTLDGDQRAWVEYSHEIWNLFFSQARWARNKGIALGLAADEYQAHMSFVGRRTSEIAALWRDEFTDDSRVVAVLSTQPGFREASEYALDFEGTAANVDAIAFSPLFGGQLGAPSEQARVRNMTTPELLAAIRTESLPLAISSIDTHAGIARDYGLALAAYDGGQRLHGTDGVENDAVVNARFDAAVRAPGMAEIYAELLGAWQRAETTYFVHVGNCGGWSPSSRVGALEYLEQPRTDAPIYDALLSFIESTPRWW